jgi:hypothetical protein
MAGALLALAVAAPGARAQDLRVRTLATGLEIPWELAFLPDGRALVSWGALDVGAMLRDNRTVAVSHSTTLAAPGGHLLRVLTQEARTQGDGARPLLVAAATDMSMHEKFGHSFQATFWSLIVITALLTGVLGWISARRGISKQGTSCPSLSSARPCCSR